MKQQKLTAVAQVQPPGQGIEIVQASRHGQKRQNNREGRFSFQTFKANQGLLPALINLKLDLSSQSSSLKTLRVQNYAMSYLYRQARDASSRAPSTLNSMIES